MKAYLKALFRLLMLLLLAPVLLLYFLLTLFCARDSLFAGFAQWLSLWPGLVGSYIRVAGYRYTMQYCAADSYIGFGTLFSQQQTEIKAGVYIGPQCNIGLCVIEEHCLLGSGVHILSGKNQHHFTDPDKPYKEQGGSLEKVRIGANCWIGNGAIVMASIGDGSIVGAGAVVTDEVPAGVIVVGNPARIVKTVAQMQKKVSTEAGHHHV